LFGSLPSPLFEGSEKPSQGHAMVRQKLFQVLIDIA